MAFVAKYFSREYLSKQIATLAKALESVSTNLSIIALLGLALVPMVPDRAASTLANRASSPPAVSTPMASAPVEVVRAKPVLVPQAPLQLEAALRTPPPSQPVPDPNAAAEPHLGDSLRVLARVSRERRRRAQQRAQPDSGDAGKAGAKTAAATTPVPNSTSEPGKAEPPVPDEWSEAEIITALKDCLKRVAPLGAEIEIAPAVKHEQCGAPAPVMLKRIGSGANRVEFQPPPMLNCAMVASLHTWIEKTLQPTAQDVLGTSIVRLRGTGGYACRNRAGSTHGDRLSEHALANAIDIMGFVTADGRTIDVLSKWGMTARDLREQKERAAQEKKERAAEPKTVAARVSDKEALGAARNAAKQALKEATEAERAAAKAPRSKRKQLQAEARRKKDEAERKANDVERLGEEAERRAEELRQGSLRTAGLQKLGKGVDVKATDAKVNAKATPTTATANEPTRPSTEAAFLRRLHKGACGTFGTVLGPEANEAHRNHFHFDLAPRRRSSFCE